jgi:hypothetical protein
MAREGVRQVLTSIEPHIRAGHAVRGYEAERAKGDKEAGGKTKLTPVAKQTVVSKESFWQDYDKRSQRIFDSQGEPHEHITTDELEHHVKSIFNSSAESGVDPIIHSHPNFLQAVYGS